LPHQDRPPDTQRAPITTTSNGTASSTRPTPTRTDPSPGSSLPPTTQPRAPTTAPSCRAPALAAVPRALLGTWSGQGAINGDPFLDSTVQLHVTRGAIGAAVG